MAGTSAEKRCEAPAFLISSLIYLSHIQYRNTKYSIFPVKAAITPSLRITADQSLLTRLFLIGYVVKYKKPGGYVWIDAERKPDGVQIRISDDGLGISEEEETHIFAYFYHTDCSRDRTGTGLGLSIVQWIAELHGGGGMTTV